MRPEHELQRDVEAELRWTPYVDEQDIAVKVNQGVVTLSGFVHDYNQRYLAEVAVKSVNGVTAVANDIVVNLLSSPPCDPEIARAAVDAIKRVLPTHWEHIKITVKKGVVSLEGHVEWQYERAAAEAAVERLLGVALVINSIVLKPSLPAQRIKSRIDGSFRGLAELNSRTE